MPDRSFTARTAARGVARRLVLATAAVAVVGCHDASDTRVTVQYVARAGTSVQGFVASLEAGQTATAFAADATLVPAPVLELKTPASGFVVVTVALFDSLGVIGGGATAIELRRDASFSVLVQIDSVNPSKNCAECLGAKAFLLPAASQRVASDSIWMVWTATSGGTAITK